MDPESSEPELQEILKLKPPEIYAYQVNSSVNSSRNDGRIFYFPDPGSKLCFSSFRLMKHSDGQNRVEAFFRTRTWKPFTFQKSTWKAYENGKSGLVHAPTGTGKTYAVWAPALIEWINEQKKGELPKRAQPYGFFG